MWDRSYRSLRISRIAAGAAAMIACAVAVGAFARTPAFARGVEAAGEISREVRPDSDSRINVEIPSALTNVKAGVLVYRETEDGTAEVVGRVIAVQPQGDNQRVSILLTPACAGAMAHGGVVKGAAPSTTLEQAVRLLLAPSVPREEAELARDALWPALDKHVLPGVTSRIEAELTKAALDLDVEDQKVLQGAIDELHKELAPLEEQLLNKLAERAWTVVGVKGVADGIWRKASDGAGNAFKSATDWVKSLWGDKNKSEPSNQDFLSDETKVALRLALEEEVGKFWEEHRVEITEKTGKVLAARKQDFIKAWNERWAPKLYERAVVPGWLEGEAEVLKAAEGYANDFARRRLLTSKGGPRLLLAYALRGALQISDAPLIVIAPDNSGKVDFAWLVP